VKELAQKLARFHALKVPLSKKNNLLKNLVDSYSLAYQKHPIDKEIRDFKLETLLSTDLKKELDYIEKLMIELDSPVVFAHNDYRNSNLLVKDEGGTEGDMIVVVDFEFANFTYRGTDFSWLFNAWGGSTFKAKPLPDDKVMRPFFEEYIQGNIKIYGKEKYLSDERNTVERMLVEVKVFHLFMMISGTVMCMKADEEKGVDSISRPNIMVSEHNRSIKPIINCN